MGLLARYSPWAMLGGQMPIPGMTPFAPNQPPEGSGQPTPPMSMSPPNKPPAPQQGGGWMNAINELPNNGLFQIGMSLLGNAQNGGNWGQVGRDMQEHQRQRMLRQRLENEERRQKAGDAREQQQFGWQREDRQRATQQRQSLDEWVAGLPPEQQAAARANPAAAHEAYMAAQAAANQPITPFQQAQLGLQRQGLAIDAMNARTAAARAQNSLADLSYADTRTINEITSAADAANHVAGQMQRFMALNARQRSGRFANIAGWFGDPEAQEMHGISQGLIPIVREMSGETGIMTNADADRIVQGIPNIQNSRETNESFAMAAQQVARNAQDRIMFYENYARTNHNLLGARSQWSQYLQRNPIYDTQGNLRADRPGFEEWLNMGAPDMRNPQRQGRVMSGPQGGRPPGVPANAYFDASTQQWVAD